MAADAEALSLYRQALEVYARAFGDQWDPLQRASFARKMGDAFFRRGEWALALEQYGQALSGLGYRLPETRGAVRTALVREVAVHLAHRLRGRPLLGAEPVSPAVEDEVGIYRSVGFIDAVNDSERAVLVFMRMFNVSERRGYALGVVLGCYGLGMALDIIGLYPRALWYHRYGLQVAEQLGAPYAIGLAYSGLQNTARCAGQLSESFEYGQRALECLHGIGNAFEETFVRSFSAWVATHWGDVPDALTRSQELARMGQDAGAHNAWCWGETILGFTLNRQGRLPEAIGHLQKAVELADAIPEPVYRTLAGSELAMCYLRQGGLERAFSELDACVRFRATRRVLDVASHMVLLNDVAEAQLTAAAQSEGAQRAGWLNKARQTLQTALREAPKYQVKSPQAKGLQGTYEWLCGKPAAAQKWWQRGLAEAQRMGMRYDEARIHLDMGQYGGAPDHLERAAAIFAEIGAELDLAQTKELMR
jgi:tetratricopeptide (TPR) repeat protein